MSCRSCFKGAIGAGKALAGIDRAPSAEIVRRLSNCDSCEHGVSCKRDPSRACRCAVCKCVLSLKTRLAGERCPVGRW